MGGATCKHSSGEDSLLATLLRAGLWTNTCSGVMWRAKVTREIVISIRQMEKSCSDLPLYAERCGNFDFSNLVDIFLLCCPSCWVQLCSESYMTRKRTLDAT